MHAHIARPVVCLAPHRITTDELCEHIRDTYPGHPRMAAWQRIVRNTGVAQRYWTRPLAEATAPAGVAERAKVAFNGALDLAERAARQAMEESGLSPERIDAIVTSHTTSWTVPGLDVHLIERLGLRPTVARTALTTMACAGGAHALAEAARYVRAAAGTRVLVVVAETLSTTYHQSETSPQSMIYRALFGDSAAATVVTAPFRANGTGFTVRDILQLVVPDSRDRYWGSIDAEGLHFESTKKAAGAARESLPYLTTWLEDAGWRPDWIVAHPGGPGIIRDVVSGVGLEPDKHGRYSYASLAENGNLGGAAVLDVLRRTHADPPGPGALGFLAGFGPGFTVASLFGTWN